MIDQFKMMDLHSYAGLESLEGLEGPYIYDAFHGNTGILQ